MKKILDVFPGWKTYGVAVGLFGLAVYQLSIEKYEEALAAFIAAIGLTFARRGASRDAEYIENQLWSSRRGITPNKTGLDVRD